MKFTSSRNLAAVLLTLGALTFAKAQEVSTDTVKKARETSKKFVGRQKIDGIIATVGDYIVLDSDIDKNFLEAAANGNDVTKITRCMMLGKLLEERLYAHQALRLRGILPETKTHGLTAQRNHADQILWGEYKGKCPLPDRSGFRFCCCPRRH